MQNSILTSSGTCTRLSSKSVAVVFITQNFILTYSDVRSFNLYATIFLADLAKRHNNANFLVLPARFIATDLAKKIVDAYLDAPFEGGRHQRRIDKIPVK